METPGDQPLASWGPERSAELAELTTAAMPGEAHTADELLSCCWDDPGVVLAMPDGTAAVSAVVRRWDDWAVGFVKLLAVHPGARRRGVGRRLLAAAEEWAVGQGASEMQLGGSAPFYLWPGVDVQALAMLCLTESAGYEVSGAALNMSVPATFRAPTPAGYRIVRVLEDDDVGRVEALVGPVWPEWLAETRRGVDQGGCFAAIEEETGTVAAFACHSVNRAAWFGPTGTAPDRRHQGLGVALLAEVCRDLMVAGYADAEICWLGPVGFYASAGGSVSRVFQLGRKRLPPT
jgi:mycothiol synthase